MSVQTWYSSSNLVSALASLIFSSNEDFSRYFDTQTAEDFRVFLRGSSCSYAKISIDSCFDIVLNSLTHSQNDGAVSPAMCIGLCSYILSSPSGIDYVNNCDIVLTALTRSVIGQPKHIALALLDFLSLFSARHGGVCTYISSLCVITCAAIVICNDVGFDALDPDAFDRASRKKYYLSPESIRQVEIDCVNILRDAIGRIESCK